MSPIDLHLLDLADAGGITIEYTRLPADRDGDYHHATRTIRLRPSMHARKHRSILAHELGHAAYGHTPTQFGPRHGKQERAAEEWAALRLIRIDDYRLAEHIHDGHLGAMALDLGVLRSVAAAYAGLLERLGTTAYLDLRMGSRQFAAKLES